jgi:beta-phosphoglucomutase
MTPPPAHRDAPVPVKAVILDFDGVVADTERLHLGAFQEVFGARGWVIGETEYFDRYIGFDDRGLVLAYISDRGLDVAATDIEAILTAKAQTFGRHLSSADILYPGARTSVELLATRFALAIASGALHHEIAAILRVAGLATLIPVIVAADDVAATKPEPGPYLAAAERLGVLPEFCVAVEDSPAGLQSAKAAGMRTIAVTTTSPLHALLHADRVVAGLHEVTPELVADLGPSTAL